MRLAGISEIAELLGVTRQRANKVVEKESFPQPVDRLKMGPVYKRSDVERWIRKHRAGMSILVALVLSLLVLAPAAAVAASPDDVPVMLDVARSELGPGCPALSVEFAEPETMDGAIGFGGDCQVVFDREWWAEATFVAACSAFEHEYGHAIDLRFPDNPSDPGHSPDPSHVMHDHFGFLSPTCQDADPETAVLARITRLERRAARRERRCVQIERRRGTHRARRCWRAARRISRAADRAWLRLEVG